MEENAADASEAAEAGGEALPPVVTQGGEESLFPPFDATQFPSHLFWLLISFGILYLLVNRLIVPKVGGLIEDRRDRIASDFGEAARLTRETDDVVTAYETELAAARQKANAIAQERRDEVKAEQERRQAETEAQLATKIADAETQIAARRDAALSDVNAIAAEAVQVILDRFEVQASNEEVTAAVAQKEAAHA